MPIISFKPIVLLILLLALFISSALAQDTNFCRDFAEEIEYGDTVEGTIDDDAVFAGFCFEGEEGDEVTVTVETIDGDLVAAVGIADPFAEEVFEEATASSRRDSAEITYVLPDDGDYLLLVSREDFADGDTEGDFELTIEVEGRSSSNNSSSNSGDTNFCEEFGQDIEYGDSEDGEITDEEPFAVYCFEGEEGDVVSVEVEAIDGDLEPTITLSDPFINEILAEDSNSRGRDNASYEFELTEDGQYLIAVTRAGLQDGDTEGEYTLTLEAEGSSPRSDNNNNNSSSGDIETFCDEEPLATLSQFQWGIPGNDPEEPLLAYNIGCTGFMTSTVVGRSIIVEYEIDRRGNMSFAIGDTTYTTIEVDDDEWVLEVSNGDELSLERLDNADCEEEPLSDLIAGVWLLSGTEDTAIDFTCGGIVFITFEGDTFYATYEVSRSDIVITAEDSELILEDFEISRGTLFAVNGSNGVELEYENIQD